jgi:hypothetical protein
MMLPSLRAIAEDIEAPYSVLMDCHKVTNTGLVTEGNTFKYEVSEIKRETYDRALYVIKKQSKEWRQERGLENKKDKTYSYILNNYQEGLFLCVQQIALEGFTNTPPSYSEEFVDFVKSNFKTEILEYKKLLLETGLKGSSILKK